MTLILLKQLLSCSLAKVYIYAAVVDNKEVVLTYTVVVWLARPSHLNAGALRAGRDGLAAVTISSHLFDQSDATGRNSC